MLGWSCYTGLPLRGWHRMDRGNYRAIWLAAIRGSAVDNDNDTGNVAGQRLADRNGLVEVLSTLHSSGFRANIFFMSQEFSCVFRRRKF